MAAAAYHGLCHRRLFRRRLRGAGRVRRLALGEEARGFAGLCTRLSVAAQVDIVSKTRGLLIIFWLQALTSGHFQHRFDGLNNMQRLTLAARQSSCRSTASCSTSSSEVRSSRVSTSAAALIPFDVASSSFARSVSASARSVSVNAASREASARALSASAVSHAAWT